MTVAAPAGSYSDLLARAFDAQVVEWTEQAEQDNKFPRVLLDHLGAQGVFARKWNDRKVTDLGDHFALARELGALGSAAIGVGVSLHDSAIAVLRRFGRTDFLRQLAEEAIVVEKVLCIAASEESGGSDLQNARTRIEPESGGYRVVGHKKFVSLSPIADYMFVVGRSLGDEPATESGNVALAVVPVSQVQVGEPYRKLGAGPLDTAAVSIDTWIPEDARIARPRTRPAGLSWGLAPERYTVAGQIAPASARLLG
uniref:acyl-CoA dehydrogenase family protein n=1 Tax=Nocardia carnea TaxID=37328 RepID=UPI0024541730